MAIDENDPKGDQAYREGISAYRQRDYTYAVKLLKVAAKKGHAEAMYDLALCYLNGQGVWENDSAGSVWLFKAADRGSARAQCHYGASLLDYGDVSNGVAWLRQSAAQGYQRARDILNSL